jgi:hypothetical protein
MARIRKTEPVLAVSAAAAAPARRKTPPATKKAAQEEIAALAYSYYATRGYFGGSPEEDWLRAEQELYQRTSALA